MRGIIKSTLAEELRNSLRMKKEYESALKKLPRGCLVSKNIKGKIYYYMVKRKGKKVKYIYEGRMLDSKVQKYQKIKKLRAQYRSNLAQLKKQIKFLKGALRGKEPI